ncbi:hypothetical protein D0962_21285 [Leptolyngbyaceae cyanobacterium CCMR0082]|uniref:Uncharacterized protein n=1 Tax=Adonisia turfae CCMR0082 TaxID=2304604 RepID=A0A6M0SB17_9CYAN|nr:hypothetical protein [Adonisia turfae]NEZ65273.1 hypothetical protein [Adonisia turfae CCMR0082]
MGRILRPPDLALEHPNASLPQKLTSAWSDGVPTIQYFSVVMPGAIYLNLTGSGVASDMPIERFETDLLRDYQEKLGHYHAYVDGHYGSEDDADIYEMVGWEVLTGSKCADNTVLIYYQEVNGLATIKKHMPEMVEDYLEENPWARAEMD